MEVKYDAMGNLTCVLDMDGYEYALTVRSHAIRRVVERWAYKNLMTSAETGKLFADMMLCKSMADFILWEIPLDGKSHSFCVWDKQQNVAYTMSVVGQHIIIHTALFAPKTPIWHDSGDRLLIVEMDGTVRETADAETSDFATKNK
ncbi:hypothetical protein [Ruthenibacterium lactatiformans]|uniref:Uncharacterized protein n=1 Tax=Ruthenibacterium lactatiformans TaxID=1550024 RepID=A0A6L6LUY8_9FIRM|nr:hypothetical protein [Ruthenibacterium lactatiformans]MTQ81600.1 hypothetical protein [Ruthenibacterium lactatiformans]MTS21530.1 hypothetical protein [Ruthenibacterium lactatiformans]MTS28560.1 hypothetical protein [Ruthenibacterium lactatiformans]MTS32271.1 hypothetical protein [Ruthenibacterium lactatiformans]MTS38860.1 hypothetical protein [Ruthenibacterium lactatiformans]